MYTTSHRREFQPFQERRNAPLRPSTTEFAAQRPYKERFVDDALPLTTNAEFHCPKQYAANEPIRSGTASGQRNNRPHPDQMFIDHHQKKLEESFGDEESEALRTAMNAQLKSTYQKSYLGITAGSEKLVEPTPGSSNRTKNTESRENYVSLTLDERIKEPQTRYGCNKNKHIPARGAVPGRVPTQPLIHATQTTIEKTPMYQTQFCGVNESSTLSKIY